MQASLPRFFSGFFFGVLRTLAELRSADCRFVDVYASVAVFSAEKTSGLGNASCGWRARFAAAKRRSPAGATTQAGSRPITQRVIAPVKRARKRGLEDGGQACLQSRFQTLFRIACRNKPTKRSVFEGARGTESTAALWQIKVDVVPMRHRAQKVLAFCATMPN